MVDFVKVFAYNDAVLFGIFALNDALNVVVNVIPERFRVASQQFHIDFIVNVADFDVARRSGVDGDSFLAFQGTVLVYDGKHLCVFPDAGWTVQNEVLEGGDGWKRQLGNFGV
jgi:hypothetical protein